MKKGKKKNRKSDSEVKGLEVKIFSNLLNSVDFMFKIFSFSFFASLFSEKSDSFNTSREKTEGKTLKSFSKEKENQ